MNAERAASGVWTKTQFGGLWIKVVPSAENSTGFHGVIQSRDRSVDVKTKVCSTRGEAAEAARYLAWGVARDRVITG